MYHIFFYNNPREQSKRTNRVILFSTILFVLFSIAMLVLANAQNNCLILNGGYINLNGGTSGTPLYLVVNQNNALGITRTGGAIIAEGEYNRLKWKRGYYVLFRPGRFFALSFYLQRHLFRYLGYNICKYLYFLQNGNNDRYCRRIRHPDNT